ncbi:bacillithiol biosynthesis cysteine-adding enzyme BshC [Lederbergia panacisoli]|uniref:bacillithiol biosynthesis cysteine-adding enzyme BshC n=1 Tax=Lederbergia panacisoli TaxID=1255251 RepID=UPI00214BC026|nr:bacillithiol biosynthesis cysteine-adding enzyme BshC [Lederbergia panacisoli]MCR2820820.1 bacillithiol biosynthesis cysteine-adding enzyme BshC [Lederbergia panacisoli]
MKFESIVIPATNDFASLYIEQKEPVKGFFHYDITENSVYEKRYRDLMTKNIDRAGIARVIENYMMKFPQSEKTKQSIDKLKSEQSVVVIGGQQAGLLTGPLYTIHKIISIIKLAEEQEHKLNKPVVPIFWIAGEDHDFLEINHIYAEAGHSLKKISFSGNNDEKRMTSHIYYNKDDMHHWIDTVFMHFGEKENTKELLSTLHTATMKYDSITDIFSFIVMTLFKDYGLLIIDSADPGLRLLEEPFFSNIIEQNVEITQAVLRQQEEIGNNGFKKAIEMDENAANLFYYLHNERILLDYDPVSNCFLSKKAQLQLDKENVLELLQQYPEKFSNNVVTRPLMQEWLFPTLAFIAGPGEIAYWGELKQAFDILGNKMPPIIPRMNMTFLEAAVERDINDLELSIDDILKNGVARNKAMFLENMADKELQSILDNVKTFMEEQYHSIFKRLEESDRGLLPLARKNLSIHLNQINFMEHKSNISIELKHQTILDKYNRIERHLRPNGIPQERVWNIYYYLNEMGESFIQQLMAETYVFDGTHKLIKI